MSATPRTSSEPAPASAPAATPLRTRRVVIVRDVALIVLFACALLAPSYDDLVRPASERDPALREMRNAAPWPQWPDSIARLNGYPGRLEAWHGDRLGYRDKFLRWRSCVRLFGFGVSPAADVLPGANGFLFYTGNHTLEMLRGVRPFSPEKLDAWVALLEARRAYYASLGARYIFAIGPNKESIYADFLPAGYEPVGPTPMDQLVRALRERAPEVEFIDMRPAFLAAREHDGPRNYLYYEPGTHWNGRGNYLGYALIANAMHRHFPAVVPFTWDELWKQELDTNPDSWGVRMYLQDLLDPHALAVNSPAASRRVVQEGPNADPSPQAVHRWTVADPALPKVVWFCDSFGGGVIGMLSEHCRELVFTLRATGDPELVAAERPDLVLELWVERILDAWGPETVMPPPPVAQPSMPPAAAPADGEPR